ncbi:MAG: CHAD domain-containing protein [Solirubrobacteraceae bacterium]|jgi:CYTH domain-containing protein/CHAD domain-containing protein
MSEQRIIKAVGEKELRLPELMRDTDGDALNPVTEIEQMMAAVRQQLTELTGSLRSDLEELRRLVSDPPPIRGMSVLTESSDSTSPGADRTAVPLPRNQVRSAAGVSRHAIDSHSGVEVERKFIVTKLPPELERLPSDRILQGYVVIGEGGLEVRLRRRGENTTLTVKKGLGRTRLEVALGAEQFQGLWALTEGRRVEKVRHLIPTDDGLTIELDSYVEELDGLATAEVEFDSEARADAFEPPPWFGREVTDDPRYSNARLACDGAPPPPRRAPEPLWLHRREATTDGIRRIVCGQIDAAIDDLGTGALEDPGEAVHACRKRFKRVRATARLVRDELGTDAYRRENAAFREFGRVLSDVRDSQVLVETLEALCARYALEVPSGAFVRLRAALADDHRAAQQHLRENATGRAPVIAELRAARAGVAAWRFRHDAVSALAPGFERIYRRGRRAFLAARKDPTDESLHELRKRSKDLWHAAQILRPAAPKMMKALADRAHRLSDLVGDDHDLAVLSQEVDHRPECLADARDAALLHALIARRRRQIQREALELAQRIFAAKPHKLAGPIRHVRAAHAH